MKKGNNKIAKFTLLVLFIILIVIAVVLVSGTYAKYATTDSERFSKSSGNIVNTPTTIQTSVAFFITFSPYRYRGQLYSIIYGQATPSVIGQKSMALTASESACHDFSVPCPSLLAWKLPSWCCL